MKQTTRSDARVRTCLDQRFRNHRARQRDYELETLAQFDKLARYLEKEASIEAPNPPKPGALEQEVKA